MNPTARPEGIPDGMMCWAASGASILHWWFDQNKQYIDMYDVCNTSGGYYMADGVITHNTAADIFKIAAARTFLFIRRNNLFGKFYITNMVVN